MFDPPLHREEAVKLITPVVDGEAGEEQCRAFYRYIERDIEVKRRYEEEKWIKYLIRHQMTRFEAPPRLKKKVSSLLDEFHLRERQKRYVPASKNHQIPDPPSSEPADLPQNSTFRKSFYKPLFLTILGMLVTLGLLGYYFSGNVFEVNELAYQHYTVQRGHFTGNYEAASIPIFPESSPIEEYYFRIPKYKGAKLAGVVSHSIMEDYQVPLIIHQMPSSTPHQQTIYTFVFDIKDIENHPYLYRSSQSIEATKHQNQFFSQQINGRFITSWQEGTHLYISISNKAGRQLAISGEFPSP